MPNYSISVPDLDLDKGHKVSPMGRLERRIVAALCIHLASHGWTPKATLEGDDWTPTTDAKSVMELVFGLGDAWVQFSKEGMRVQRIRLIEGNGTDIISDYTCGLDDFNAAVEAFDTESVA